jgi:integrase
MYSMAEVTPSLIVECRDKLLQEITYKGTKRSCATTNRYLAAFSHALTIAVKEWGWIEHNPMSKVGREKEPTGRVRFLSDDERNRLLDACRNSRNQQLYLIVMLALTTGSRQGEILGLKWENVSFDLKRIILVDTKNGETRAVPLVGEAFSLLKEYSKIRRIDTTLVFPRAGLKGRQPISIRTAWDNAIDTAKVDNFHFHDLRHSCASYLAMNGATLAEIAEVLGHKTLQMVKRYAHLSEQHTLSVVERMNEKIFGIHATA